VDSQRQNHLADSGEERYLDVHEAAEILEVGEEELWELVHRHEIPAHNIAGAFLRFKKDAIEDIKNKWRIERELFPEAQRPQTHQSHLVPVSTAERLKDFWYFNDFYVICSALVVVLLYFIISSQ
jgi:excisionase family DNA binding protein